jgi:hypothetical protein
MDGDFAVLCTDEPSEQAKADRLIFQKSAWYDLTDYMCLLGTPFGARRNNHRRIFGRTNAGLRNILSNSRKPKPGWQSDENSRRTQARNSK